jgi:hypothetical protein
MMKQGIAVSQRQVDAFLTPALASSGGAIDYSTFAALARPRAPCNTSTPGYIRPADFSSDGARGHDRLLIEVRLADAVKDLL